MKILSKTRGYAHIRVKAQLEGDEVDLPDEVLVMMADGKSRSNATHIHIHRRHPGHFGYCELQREGNSFHVVIYTD
jgi:hypothetical protein